LKPHSGTKSCVPKGTPEGTSLQERNSLLFSQKKNKCHDNL